MAHVTKKCNCRDDAGRQLGKNCPQLTKRDHGGWWFRYEAPPDPGTGKRRRPWAGPFRTKGEADAEARKRETDAAAGMAVADGSMRFGVWLETVWLPSKKRLKASTYESYEEAVRLYGKPGLGHLKLGDVREHHLAELYTAMGQINVDLDGPPSEMLRRLLAVRARAPWRTPREGQEPGLNRRLPLTSARIQRVHRVLSSALGTAFKQRLIPHNPAPHVELPPVRRARPLVWTAARVERWRRTGQVPGPVMVWTPAQAGAFLDHLEAGLERLYPLYHLVTTRGLRRHEAAALAWPDVDLDAGTLMVLEAEGDDEGLKSESSWRTVSLGAENVKLLREWRGQQRHERLAAGEAWKNSGDAVFTYPDGRPYTSREEYLSERFAALVSQAGLPPIRLHDLRHCAASLMLAAGVDMKVVSATLGHSRYAFTADTYTSVVPQVAEAAAEATVAIIPRRRSSA
jgi:integrase